MRTAVGALVAIVAVLAACAGAAASHVPEDVLREAAEAGYMSAATDSWRSRRSAGAAGAGNRAARRAAAAGTTGPWYQTSVENGPPCPTGLPLADSITADDVSDALEAVSQMATAALNNSKYSPPGIHVSIVYGDTVLMSKGFGTTNVNFTGTAPVTDDSLFRIGSNTKPFVTLAYHRAAEMGIVGVNDPLSQHLPEFVYNDPFNASGPITLHHLATFQAGLQRESCSYFASTKTYGCGLLVGDNATAVWDAMRLTSTLFPRNSFSPIYSNLQIQLLAYALDHAIAASDATPYGGIYPFIQGEIFDKLGFTGTGFNVTAADQRRFAWSKASALNNYCRFRTYGFANPSGGMFMSGSDFGKWASYLVSGADSFATGKIVRPETLRAFLRPVTLFPAGTSGYGFSTFVAYMDGHWVTTKGGAVPGYQSAIAVVPSLKLGIAVLTSGGSFDASSITVPGLAALIPAVETALATNSANSAQAMYGGTYSGTAGGKAITLIVNATSDGLKLKSAELPSTDAGLLLPAEGLHQFYILPDDKNSCYLDLVEVSAQMSGTLGHPIYSADTIQFDVDASGVVTGVTQPMAGISFKRTSTKP